MSIFTEVPNLSETMPTEQHVDADIQNLRPKESEQDARDLANIEIGADEAGKAFDLESERYDKVLDEVYLREQRILQELLPYVS